MCRFLSDFSWFTSLQLFKFQTLPELTRAFRLETRTRGLDSKLGLGLESQTRVQNESKNFVKLHTERCLSSSKVVLILILIAVGYKINQIIFGKVEFMFISWVPNIDLNFGVCGFDPSFQRIVFSAATCALCSHSQKWNRKAALTAISTQSHLPKNLKKGLKKPWNESGWQSGFSTQKMF